MKKTNLSPFRIIVGLLFLIIILTLVYPMLTMLVNSFQAPGSGAFTLDNYIQAFTKSSYQQAFSNSILLSLYSSTVGLIVCTIATYSIVSQFPKLRSFFLSLSNLTTNYVGISLAFGMILLLGNAGVLTNFGNTYGINFLSDFNVYSLSGLLLVYIYFQLPLGITLLIPTFDALDKNWREAAELLGADTLQYWLKIGLPVLAPSLVGVFAIMFANAMGTYDSAVALTGDGIKLISTEISNTISGDIFARPEVGSALSVVLAVILAFNMYVSRWLGNRFKKVNK